MTLSKEGSCESDSSVPEVNSQEFKININKCFNG